MIISATVRENDESTVPSAVMRGSKDPTKIRCTLFVRFDEPKSAFDANFSLDCSANIRDEMFAFD